MINFLNDIRNAENPISNNRKLINTIAILFLGIALGTFSKYLDFRQTELPGVLMAINGVLDIGNFLGRFAIWILIALCISIYSNSAIRASINVFVFFVGMVASYYLYSNYIAGFFPRSYAMIWFGFTAVSPLLAFVCWYAKGKSKLAFILSALILAVLFNMCFVYGCWYFNAKSVLEVIVFIIGLIVLRRDTLRSSALMGTISIVLAVYLIWLFHFILDKQLQVCQSFHHRANLTRTFRTEYHPPTSGHLSRKSETVSCFSFVPNEVVNHHPIQSTTGRRKPLCPVPTMI